MLEGLAAWVLNNYLGKYVENLNTDQLSIALLSGKVELENLPLRKDALRHLGLPVEIKAGFIGKVRLQIPVSQIRSAPWVIGIEQLYFVASPLPVYEWDALSEELSRQELKLAALDTIEAKWRLETDSSDNGSTYYASSYSSWLSFGTGVISDIVENIQLKIQDVHIRYEDSISIPNKNVAFGITIDALVAQSCDSNWISGFRHWDKMGESFKLLEMQNLSLYWIDLEEKELLSKLSLGELAIAMSPSATVKNTKHNILLPVSAQAHIKRNRSEQPLRSIDTPRIVCDLVLEEVPLTIIDWQYDQIIKCVRGLDDISRLRSYRRYKPSTAVKEDPRLWWLYAISCFYPTGKQPAICKPRPTWEFCLQRARENVKYANIYKKILLTPNITLSTEEKKLKDDVEWDREFNELKVLREISMKSVTLPNRKGGNNNSAGRSMLENWFPQWIGWYSSNSDTSSASPEAKQLEGEILKALADSAENNTLLKRDVVFGKFNFCLKRGCINLCSSTNDPEESASMLELEFKNLSLNIVSKPRTSSHLIELGLGSLYLKDKITLNTLFPILVGPPGFERTYLGKSKSQSPRVSSVVNKADESNGHLFYLSYEKKPHNTDCDYRLCIRSKCLDIVYQPNAVRWITEFLCLPYQKDITQLRIEAMKSRTKRELIKNWEHILDGRNVNRTMWDLQFDISAPQIIFVEQFSESNSSMAVIDFGRLQLRNNFEQKSNRNENSIDVVDKCDLSKASEEDDTFVTPCSTPPQSEASDSEELTLDHSSTTIEPLPLDALNEVSLHHKLYDRYTVELTDLQILVGKVKDNWRYAHNKGSSTLHVLDRFNISIQIERRIIHTADPWYPSLTVNANLPKLIAHLNETKISATRNLLQIITTTGLPSPFKTPDNSVDVEADFGFDDEQSISIDTSIEMSRLLTMQFTVDQMSLEVQSRGRSVAELQVAGVKVAFMKRSVDMSVTLTVHSLLLVDALQTFGPDFELLVASHKHVGMDSMSGSLRDSEPTSPCSPASPDPNLPRPIMTSPVALTQALSSLAGLPPTVTDGFRTSTVLDAEALILIEVVIVTGQEPMQIANVQFNNLDIIANQETIVELVGFMQRVFPKSQKQSTINLAASIPRSVRQSNESLSEDTSPNKIGTTEITFDFHRLNVLLLRGVVRDGTLQGKKICTATMSEAKIQATVSKKVEIEGSLGGLQVLDLTPEGCMHQRIVSVGKDPLLEDVHPLYLMSLHQEDERTAFSFKVVRHLEKANLKDVAEITIRMASLWYTHSPQFVSELQSCATEFKQYMSNLARSIRTAATDMALGLVHARAEALAQSLYMNARLSSSIYGSALSFASESASPRKRRKSGSVDASGYSTAKDSYLQTPYSPDDNGDFVIDINLDIELDTPVVVLPRSSSSAEVFVAHLGKITVSNKYPSDIGINGYHNEFPENRTEYYDIEIRDMNLCSLDISNRRVPGPTISKSDKLYDCDMAKLILHDTILQLHIEREICKNLVTRNSSDFSLLLDDEETPTSTQTGCENIQITGSVVTALKLSLTRMQYEQLLETVQWLTSSPKLTDLQGISRTNPKLHSALGDISEEDTGVTTLNMDPHVRAKLFSSVASSSKAKSSQYQHPVNLKVAFELPIFIVELRGAVPSGEQGLIDISFCDFVFNYEKCHRYETNVQVSLRSVLMEDLLQPEDSKQRSMMVSSSGGEPPPCSTCVSRSYPDVRINPYMHSPFRGSLPDHLETSNVFGLGHRLNLTANPYHNKKCPCTPPPSPSQGKNRSGQNLVLISTLFVDPSAPNFDSHYNSIQRSTSVDFNCLDLMVNVESWVLLTDFFNSSSSRSSYFADDSTVQSEPDISAKENAETNLTVRSLTIVLLKSDSDVAKVNISNIEIAIKNNGLRKEVEGKLGSMSLIDLTWHGHLYRERFLTSGKQALRFKYVRHLPNPSINYDAQLNLDMSSVMYIHTKRFVAELQAFFNHFTQLQSVMAGIRAATSGQKINDEPLRLFLVLQANSPLILLPVSSKSPHLLVADLGHLLVKNTFKLSGDKDTISVVNSALSDKKAILDVMTIELENMDLYTGLKENEMGIDNESNEFTNAIDSSNIIKLGGNKIRKSGDSLLTKKFQLRLQVERNLHNSFNHCVPDMSIYGQLSTLDATLDLAQYTLIRGLLAYNLSEDTEHVLPSVATPPQNVNINILDIWTLSSLKFDLQNVTLRLQKHKQGPTLSCINFIKSRLTVESFSNLSQDIDLVSQEILVLDSRFDVVSNGGQPNIFVNILQPIKYLNNKDDLVQAEIHSRKREGHTKFTILLNNMRLMAVFDWWEAIKEYIFHEIENVSASPQHQKTVHVQSKKEDQATFELKLNITDSEIVVVEDASQWDTNAVILKSTTVITFKPNHVEKPLSCSLNHCEMFSCVLGMEEETALSIIDPVTLTIDVNEDRKLEAQLQFLTVRLSYHDMKMFLQILNSLPKQMFAYKESEERQPAVYKNHIRMLISLGFAEEDCVTALENTSGKVDDAALWLTKNAIPCNLQNETSLIKVDSLEIKANCISVCIIDDCGDSDVPLLEFSFTDLLFSQVLTDQENKDPTYRKALIKGCLASDYYNRVLSGWEPILEPWNCHIGWYNSLSLLNVEVASQEILNINITSALISLYKQVKENWTKDYYNVKDNHTDPKELVCSPTYRQRSPFVPYALKNDTGSLLHFCTVISAVDKSEQFKSDEWISVSPGETIAFFFKTRGKLRHQDSHKMRMHQLSVRVEGWQELAPVSVDKVGVYFRQAPVLLSLYSRFYSELPPARIVFDVALEGSARKLVTIRSALLIKNKLPEDMEVKFESLQPADAIALSLVANKSFVIKTGQTLAVPLQHAHSEIDIRPYNEALKYTFCHPPISWTHIAISGESIHELRTCHTHKGHNYRYCVEIAKEKYAIDRNHKIDQPAHRITLFPSVKIVNLLPLDITFKTNGNSGRITAGNYCALTSVNPEKSFELDVLLENFVSNTPIKVPSSMTDFTSRVRLEDSSGRKLYLQSVISFNTSAKVKIAISASYWVINKTGLPLVFKQAGTSTESAGQFEEHELARLITPLLFSFSDQDASPTINARVGYHVIRDGSPQWCSNFHVQKGTQFRKLRVTMRDGRPDRVFLIGIEIRQGRGRYRSTNIITISPRYQLHNKSSYQLIFCQSYFTKAAHDHKSQKTCLKLLPESHMAFHWPRLDQEQLLCVSIHDIPDCCWSGGLPIDSNNSMHVNVRDSNGRVYFLRLEVVLQGATFFIVFTDADRMPPPLRVDNFSEVSITFAQTSYKDVQHSTARAHSSVPYAWDQPTESPTLSVIAPGAVSNVYDMDKLGSMGNLTYENFIYIAFVGTFKISTIDPLNIESQELVLDIVNGVQVVLGRKRHGQRSQLWRMTSAGQLQHEGSSPPSHPGQPRSNKILVLDIENTAPQPNTFSRLMLRKVDLRRTSTQTWRFTDDGLLCCAHFNMCVQAQDGFFGLRPGNSVVFGMPQAGVHQLTDKGVPIEQAIERQRLRPGSGFLSVEIAMDGPTRVLIIKDMKEKSAYAKPDERDWNNISIKQRPNLDTFEHDDKKSKSNRREFQFTMILTGIGVSLVCCKSQEELLYASFSNIVAQTLVTPDSKFFSVSVENVQVDNQLFDSPVPVVLHVTPPSARNFDEGDQQSPAILFQADMQQKLNENAVIFKYLILRLKRITAILEERLLLKLFAFVGFDSKKEELVNKEENDHETQRLLTEGSAAQATRYYFGMIQLVPRQIRLSVRTASKLSPHLQRIKKKLGLTLIKFEDAAVDLQAFDKRHPFETSQLLLNSIIKHFKDELMWQAGMILGSVDFLGNPLGFVNDVSEGLSGFLYEGNVGVLVKNVTHGISNSAAKVTESLSDGLGKVSMDDRHEEIRQKIRQVETGRSRDHIVAGFKGLGFGLLGGATSVFKQVYEGASNDGIQGVFSGFGKGLVGAFTKPVVGVLDFASETARAVRDSSRSKTVFERQRLPRCVQGYGGLLPRYSLKQSQGQQYLYMVNDKDFREQLIAFEVLGSASEDLQCIISNEKIRIVAINHVIPDLTPIIDCHIMDLIRCDVICEEKDRFYIEIVMHAAGTSSSAALVNPDPVKKPRVRCRNADIARTVSQQINYAKRLYTEYLYTLITDSSSNSED